MSLDDHIAFVKQQLEYHERHATKARAAGKASHLHEKLLYGFQLLLPYLEALPVQTSAQVAAPKESLLPQTVDPLAAVLQSPTQVNPALLEGLPPELIEQLAISDTDKFQWQVVELVNRTPDRIISIEVLLIALYKTTGKVLERAELSNRIYRMMRKKMVFSVNGKKGWYTTIPTDAPELDLEPEAGVGEEK